MRPEEINAVKTMRRISLGDPCFFSDNGCLTAAAFFTAVLRGRGESLDSLTTVDFLTAGFFRVLVSSVAMLSPYGFTRTVYALYDEVGLGQEVLKYIVPSDFLTQTSISWYPVGIAGSVNVNV